MSLRRFAQKSRVLLEDELFTAPRRAFAPTMAVPDEEGAQRQVHELRERGYTSLGRFVDAEELGAVAEAIDRAVQDGSAKWSESVRYWSITHSLRLAPCIAQWAARPRVMGLIERYFRRAPYLADVDMRRVLPVDYDELGPGHVSSSTWHKDTRGRQVKLMIYLSDVGEHDSNFAFVPGSHLDRHSRVSGSEESRFRDSAVSGAEVKEWFGRAGDAMLFDTNLIHRLRRKPGAAVRDSVTFYYTPGQALYALGHDPEVLERLAPAQRAIFGPPRWPLVRR